MAQLTSRDRGRDGSPTPPGPSALPGPIRAPKWRTREDGRTIFWPEGLDPAGLPPFRQARPEQRGHADVPLVELASLARRFLDEGADREDAVRPMASHFALGSLREATRKRLLAGVERARPE